MTPVGRSRLYAISGIKVAVLTGKLSLDRRRSESGDKLEADQSACLKFNLVLFFEPGVQVLSPKRRLGLLVRPQHLV